MWIVVRQSERSIHEMLKDTPPLRESSDSITSGTEPKFPTSRSMPFPPAYGKYSPDIEILALPIHILRKQLLIVEKRHTWN